MQRSIEAFGEIKKIGVLACPFLVSVGGLLLFLTLDIIFYDAYKWTGSKVDNRQQPGWTPPRPKHGSGGTVEFIESFAIEAGKSTIQTELIREKLRRFSCTSAMGAVTSTLQQANLMKLVPIFAQFPPSVPENATSDSQEEGKNVQANNYFNRHCEQPTIDPVNGDIKGEIPSWLNGTFITNGPGILKVGQDEYNHVFDGLALLHRYHIENGQVTYSSRPLESDSYKQNMEANRIVVSEFGTTSFLDPCKSLFQKLQATFHALTGKTAMTDNCNVNIGYYGDQLYAMTETNYVRRIDPDDLKTIGKKINLTECLAVNHATAHPHILPDGSALNMGNNYRHKRGPHYCVIKIPPTFGQQESALTGAKVVAEIPCSSWRKPSYYHSFGMSKNWIVFVESPLRIDVLKIMSGAAFSKPFIEAMVWDANFKTKFHVVSIENGKILSIIYEADPFCTFHHINTFELDGHLVVDLVAYTNSSALGLLQQSSESKLKESSCPYPRRYALPLSIPEGAKAGTNLVTLKGATSAKATLTRSGQSTIYLEPEDLTKSTVELPRINYRYNGSPYNFFYGVSMDDNKETSIRGPDSITKTNIQTKQVTRWQEKGMSPSEPIFVVNPTGNTEDDGVILSALTHNEEPNAVTLLILDAKLFTEIARVQFATAGALTTTFHGQWARQDDTIHFY